MKRFLRETGSTIQACLPNNALAELIGAGLLRDDGSALRATEAGHLHLDTVINRLLS